VRWRFPVPWLPEDNKLGSGKVAKIRAGHLAGYEMCFHNHA
jgi:hypothetical protein